jgi:hypothetical protein
LIWATVIYSPGFGIAVGAIVTGSVGDGTAEVALGNVQAVTMVPTVNAIAMLCECLIMNCPLYPNRNDVL